MPAAVSVAARSTASSGVASACTEETAPGSSRDYTHTHMHMDVDVDNTQTHTQHDMHTHMDMDMDNGQWTDQTPSWTGAKRNGTGRRGGGVYRGTEVRIKIWRGLGSGVNKARRTWRATQTGLRGQIGAR